MSTLKHRNISQEALPNMGCFSVLIVLCLMFLVPNVGASSRESSGPVTLASISHEVLNRKEFTRFCELGFLIRENPNELQDNEECAVTEPQEFNAQEDLPMLFTLIMICAWGAFVRAVAKHFQITIPYTVLLIISGALFGGLNRIPTVCEKLHQYTAIARISSEHILYTFLPILIFESAFSTSVHTFTKSFSQIFVLAFPGMLVATFMTAAICYQFFTTYKWKFLVACLFGSIVSATDPVAVVAILRDLGVSEQLGVLIDGESLMNDGVAILLFEIFHEFVVHDTSNKSATDSILHILLKFLQIAGGGPIWGWITARILIFLLAYVYNDAPVEIAATICAAYLTYWSSEYVLGVSGVIAVVVLGITLGAERTVISPESEGPVHHFWEMLGYLANTILFVLVGIVISETAISHFTFIDVQYLILLYVALHLSRFMMLVMFYPLLKLLGYGLEWQNMIVLMWGGLRGAVGICLALQIYEDGDLCSDLTIGPKILFHTAGIVMLTLVINGTTTKALLKTLRLTEVTVGQREEMNNAVRRMKRTKWELLRSFQMARHMRDTRFDMVEQLCHVANPYQVIEAKADKESDSGILRPPRPIRDNTTVCWNCNSIVLNEPTISDYREMTNDARMRAIKSMKIHYLHLFEKGTLTEQAVQILLADAENTEDKYMRVIQAQNFHKYMKVHGFYLWLRNYMVQHFSPKEDQNPGQPSQQWRQPFYWIVTRDWFDIMCLIIITFNTVTVIWDVSLTYYSEHSDDQCKWTPAEQNIKLAFHYTNYIFAAFYTLEQFLKICGLDMKFYLGNPWNYLDLVALIVAYIDLYLSYLATDRQGCQTAVIQGNFREYISLIKGLRLLQFVRSLRLLRPIVPRILVKIKKGTNFQVFIGYDMGKGFVETSDAVIKFIPQIAENKKVQLVLRHGMKRERDACVKDLALIHSKFPGVAVALKTRHACRAVLNQMQMTLTEVLEGGLLDDPEYQLLKRIIEEKMKRLTHSPYYITPTKELDTHDGYFGDAEEGALKDSISSQPELHHDSKLNIAV